MRALLALLVSAHLLASCAATSEAWRSGNVKWSGNVEWVEAKDAAEMSLLCTSQAVRTNGGTLAGCFERIGSACRIVTFRVTREDDFRVIGHELAHCAVGYFHNANGEWKRN